MNRTKVTDKHVQMLFALLRASLHEVEPENVYFQHATDEEWERCFRLSVAQGVSALAWGRIMQLPPEMRPPLGVKLTWASRVEMYEKTYRRYCHTAVELSEYYAHHGIVMMQMKGVGLSTLYPVPTYREGGDIDIYTYSADRDRMSDEEANRLADELMLRDGVDVDTDYPKHSKFYYKGIPIENHKTFLNVDNFKIAAQIDQILRREMNPQPTPLANGQVMTPSGVFNTLFIAFHALQHYGSGLALHHLCDWAVILKHYGLNIPDEVTDSQFLTDLAAMTRLCNEYLGTKIRVEGGEAVAALLLDEMLNPQRTEPLPTTNRVGIIAFKIKRMLRAHRKKNKVLYSSLWNRVWTSVISHIRNPETIFS